MPSLFLQSACQLAEKAAKLVTEASQSDRTLPVSCEKRGQVWLSCKASPVGKGGVVPLLILYPPLSLYFHAFISCTPLLRGIPRWFLGLE